MKRPHGYVGKVWDRESWWQALKSLVQEGTSSELDPRYLSDELTIMAESVLLLLDTDDKLQDAVNALGGFKALGAP